MSARYATHGKPRDTPACRENGRKAWEIGTSRTLTKENWNAGYLCKYIYLFIYSYSAYLGIFILRLRMFLSNSLELRQNA